MLTIVNIVNTCNIKSLLLFFVCLSVNEVHAYIINGLLGDQSCIYCRNIIIIIVIVIIVNVVISMISCLIFCIINCSLPPAGVQSTAISVSVCIYVCLCICIGPI